MAVQDELLLVDKYPLRDQKCQTRGTWVRGGGPVPTALVAFSRLGGSAFMLGRLGDDPRGHWIRDDLGREGVDVSRLQLSPSGCSPRALIVVDAQNGERTIFEWHEETSWPTLGEIDFDLLERAEFLFVDGRNPEVQISAARKTRQGGGRVMLDCGRPRPGWRELAAHCDVCVFSQTLLRLHWGEDADAAAALAEIRSWGPTIAGFTLGSRGSILRGSEGLVRTEGFRVAVRDTTGAGDVFHGGLAWALATKMPLAQAARWANAAAALKCRAMGGREGIPLQKEVAAFLAEDPGDS